MDRYVWTIQGMTRVGGLKDKDKPICEPGNYVEVPIRRSLKVIEIEPEYLYVQFENDFFWVQRNVLVSIFSGE